MLYAGTAKVDITPKHPVPLAGYAFRAELGPAEEVQLPLFARVICFRHERGDGSKPTTAILISGDIICWAPERTEALKRRIRERWSADAVLLNATHTHSGPQTSVRFSGLIGKADPSYVEWLEEQVLDGITRASARMEPVTVERGRGECPIAMNRRQKAGDKVVIGPNPEGPVDRELTVLRYKTADARVKAVVIHYACHPVTSTANQVSSEYPGAAIERLEQSHGEDTLYLFLQGTCGDVNPSDGKKPVFGGEPEVRMLGRMLADDISRILNSPMEALVDAPLLAQSSVIALPLQPLPDRASLQASASQAGILGEWSRALLQSPERMRPELELEATVLTLAEGAGLLAMNGEIVGEYGRFIKEATGGSILPLGYSNGMIGYVPTARQLEEGGYEPIDSTRYFFMPAPFAPEVEQTLKRGLLELLKA